MILIADSGSSKTEWGLIVNKNDIRNFQSTGLNPYFINSSEIENELKKNLLPFVNEDKITKLFFYGSGCGNLQKKDIVREPLEKIFRLADVEVENDILGAARSLLKNNRGIVCILGTGSNSCLYDGNSIIQNINSLGYIFGDEGSGAFIGKNLITSYLRDELPTEIKNKFENIETNTFYQILDSVYKKPFPNRYLATYTQFVFDNISHPYIKKLVFNSFDSFFELQIQSIKNYSNER